MKSYWFSEHNGKLVCDVYDGSNRNIVRGKQTINILFELNELGDGKEEIDSKNYHSYEMEDGTVVRFNKKDNTLKLIENMFNNRATYEKQKKKPVKRGIQKTAVTVGLLVALVLGGKHLTDVKVDAGNQIEMETDDDSLDQSLFETIPEDSETEVVKETIETEVTPDTEEINAAIEETVEPLQVNVDVTSSTDDKLQENVERYEEYINENSSKWGISPSIIKAMMAHESSGGEVKNLMQIQFDSWNDQILTAYNAEEGRDIKLVLTDNPGNYTGQVDFTISRQELLNPKTNVSVASMILQYNAKEFNNNVCLTIIGYNLGTGATKTLINEAATQLGRTPEDLINDQTFTSYNQYYYVIKEKYGKNFGDPNYFQNIISKSNGDETFKIGFEDDDPEIQYITR